jgi:hypothetical protein
MTNADRPVISSCLNEPPVFPSEVAPALSLTTPVAEISDASEALEEGTTDIVLSKRPRQ